MRLVETEVAGVHRVEPDPRTDARGAFIRFHCPGEFAAAGAPFEPAQTSLSRNPRKATLRGMHYSRGDQAETKLVRVVRGRIWDVALDLRPDSPSYLKWTASELSADNSRALLIPPGVAHGFITLEPDTDILYQIAPMHRAGHDAGVRWDDPAFGIDWPLQPALMSERDATYPDYRRPEVGMGAAGAED